MSALTLTAEFTHPNKCKETSKLGGIHKALLKAWADGKLISFIDDAGNVLREEKFGVHGSAAVAHPQIFATSGTPSPSDKHVPATYQEFLAARGGHDDDEDVAIAPTDEEPDDEADEPPDPSDENLDQVLSKDELVDILGAEVVAALPADMQAASTRADVDDLRLIAAVQLWEPQHAPPDWVPESILGRWATTPPAVDYWRQRLDRASKLERSRLLRYGVRRKGGIGPDSLTARGLGEFVRSDLPHWQSIASRALSYYDRNEDLAPADIPDIAADPVAAYVDGAPAEVVLLVGLALDLDEASLREVADDFGADGNAPRPSAEEERKFEAENRAAETADLRDQLKKAYKEIEKLAKERDALAENLERLRVAEREAGSVEKKLADEQARVQGSLRQIADLEVELEAAREEAARVDELTSQVQALEELRDQLLAESASASSERALRLKAEDEVQQQIRKVGELTRQLRDPSHAPPHKPRSGWRPVNRRPATPSCSRSLALSRHSRTRCPRRPGQTRPSSSPRSNPRHRVNPRSPRNPPKRPLRSREPKPSARGKRTANPRNSPSPGNPPSVGVDGIESCRSSPCVRSAARRRSAAPRCWSAAEAVGPSSLTPASG
jgi:hypothetical protein